MFCDLLPAISIRNVVGLLALLLLSITKSGTRFSEKNGGALTVVGWEFYALQVTLPSEI